MLLLTLFKVPATTNTSSLNFIDYTLPKTEICVTNIPTFKIDIHTYKKSKKNTELDTKYEALETNIFVPYKRVNMKFHSSFKEALLDCPYTDKCLVTSAFSHSKCHSKKSKHKKGLAIDVDWGNSGEKFLQFLDSTEGIE